MQVFYSWLIVTKLMLVVISYQWGIKTYWSSFSSTNKAILKNVCLLNDKLTFKGRRKKLLFNAHLIFYSYPRLENAIIYFQSRTSSVSPSVWSHLFKFMKKGTKKKKKLECAEYNGEKKPWFLAWLHRPQQRNFRHRVGEEVGKKEKQNRLQKFPPWEF